MKKYLSVAALYIRSSLYRVLLVILVMVACEGAVFGGVLYSAVRESIDSREICPPNLETLVAYSHLGWICVAAFVIVFVLLMLAAGNSKSATRFTLKRLRIPDNHIFWIHAFTSMLYFFLFWAAQVVFLYVIAEIYVRCPIMPHTGQTVMMMFYRNGFWHGMFPLSDVLVHIRNVLLLAELGIATACFQPLWRQTRVLWEPYALMTVTITWFGIVPGEWMVGWLLIVFLGVVDCEMMIRIRSKGGNRL